MELFKKLKAKVVGITAGLVVVGSQVVSGAVDVCENETGTDLFFCQISNNLYTIIILFVALAVGIILLKAFTSQRSA